MADDDDIEGNDRLPMFDLDSKSVVGKAMAYWSAGEMLFRSGKKIYTYAQMRRQLTITLTSKDVIYIPVLEWLARDEFSSGAKEVAIAAERRFDPEGGSYKPSSVRVVQNTRQTQIIHVAGYKIRVVLQDIDTTKRNSDSGTRLIFTTYNEEAHQFLINKFLEMYDVYTRVVRPPRLYMPAPWGGFRSSDEMPPRPLDSVILKKGELEYLINDMESFLSSEQRYTRLGIPWHRGYLFHGTPGTGKTSIAKAIAAEFGLDVYYVSLGDIKEDNALNSLMAEIKPRSVLLLEDIDVFSAATSRTTEGNTLSLSGLLNALDGVNTPHGVIKIMTTNVIDSLDSALIRSGRVDVQHEFTLLDDRQGQELFKYFYGFYPPKDVVWFEGLAPSTVVGIFKQHLDDPDAAIRCLTPNEEVSV